MIDQKSSYFLKHKINKVKLNSNVQMTLESSPIAPPMISKSSSRNEINRISLTTEISEFAKKYSQQQLETKRLSHLTLQQMNEDSKS